MKSFWAVGEHGLGGRVRGGGERIVKRGDLRLRLTSIEPKRKKIGSEASSTTIPRINTIVSNYVNYTLISREGTLKNLLLLREGGCFKKVENHCFRFFDNTFTY